jgi:hypothetical protein
MEIRGNTDGLHSPFIVHADGYCRRKIKAAGQGVDPAESGHDTDNKIELQQLDPVGPGMASRMSNMFVVGDDSDDDEDLADEVYSKDVHDTLDSGQGDVISDGNAITSPAKIVSRHKPILCSVGHLRSLRASTNRQALVSLQGQRAYLPDTNSESATSSPLVQSPNGKSDLDLDGKSTTVTDTFTTPEKPALDYEPIQVLPDGYLCDDVSGYNSDCDDGYLTTLPLTADKLVRIAKLKKHMGRTFEVGECDPKIINNIKALRPGRKAYQGYPDYMADAWEEDVRDPAAIPTVLRLSSPDIESHSLSNRPECTAPPPEAWEYVDAVKVITHRLGAALGGNDRPLVYGLMRMPPHRRRFVMDGLVNLYGSAKAAMGQLPPWTPSPPWLGRPVCLSPLPMTPVQVPDVDSHVCPESEQCTSYRTSPRRPLPAAPIRTTAETDIQPVAGDAQVEKGRAHMPLPFTPSPDFDMEPQVRPEDTPSAKYQTYRPPSLLPTAVQPLDGDKQATAEHTESIDFPVYDNPPPPFTPSPDNDTETQSIVEDIFPPNHTDRAPSSRSGSLDSDVSSGTDSRSEEAVPPPNCLYSRGLAGRRYLR